MKLVIISFSFFLLRLISGHDLNDCRVVCSPHAASPTYALRGKQGPKGEKGETGLPGKDCPDNADLFSSMQKRLEYMERFFYRKISSTDIAKECGMGVQKKAVVSDNQLSDGSHYHNLINHSGINGRLFGRYGYGGAWSGGYDSFQRTSGVIYNDLWIQVDFLKDVNVTGVVTQGRPVSDDDQWVTSYLIKYLEEGQNNFVTVKDKNNQPMIFQGNSDRSTPVINKFDKTIEARQFRIQVVSWNGYPSLRFDFINC